MTFRTDIRDRIQYVRDNKVRQILDMQAKIDKVKADADAEIVKLQAVLAASPVWLDEDSNKFMADMQALLTLLRARG